jgi:hypothetical protein
MARWKVILGFIAFMILAGIAGQMDYEDALLAEADYCDRLLNKEHSDYNNLRETCAERYWSK